MNNDQESKYKWKDPEPSSKGSCHLHVSKYTTKSEQSYKFENSK